MVPQVTGHGEIADSSCQGNCGSDVMEDSVGTVLGEGVRDDDEGGEAHERADGPQPVRAVSVDCNVGACGIVERIVVGLDGFVTPFVEVVSVHLECGSS